jgi:hypothetical protein
MHIKYYAIKSNIFFLLIIKVILFNEFNVLNLNLWILSTKKKSIPHWHTLPCFHLVGKIILAPEQCFRDDTKFLMLGE